MNMGNEYVLLADGNKFEFRRSQLQLVLWDTGEHAAQVARANDLLARVAEVLRRDKFPLNEALVSRITGHVWTVSAGQGHYVVRDYRNGLERTSSQDDPAAVVNRNLLDLLGMNTLVEGAYAPIPCLRYHVPHNLSATNYCARGYSVRCYRTLVEVSGELIVRTEFGVSVRGSIWPELLAELEERAIVKPR